MHITFPEPRNHPHRFHKFYGEDGLVEFIKKTTSCTIYSGSGINYRKENKTCILNSVDETGYYDDDLSNANIIEYTLQGLIGNQNLEKICNKNLLDNTKTKYVYLFRTVKENNKRIGYIWYGKYKINREKIYTKQHPDKNNNIRTIIIITLEKIY